MTTLDYRDSSLLGMSKIAIWEKMNRTEWDGMRLNDNGIGFENTIDYRSWMENKIN